MITKYADDESYMSLCLRPSHGRQLYRATRQHSRRGGGDDGDPRTRDRILHPRDPRCCRRCARRRRRDDGDRPIADHRLRHPRRHLTRALTATLARTTAPLGAFSIALTS